MFFSRSYFSIPDPFAWLENLLHPMSLQKEVNLDGKPVTVLWTRRAQKQLDKRTSPLAVEMQLYFSCVVQKRVLFHDNCQLEVTRVNDRLGIVFHAVESDICSPETFAEKHPVKNELHSVGAKNMRPSVLRIDYKNKQWAGMYSI